MKIKKQSIFIKPKRPFWLNCLIFLLVALLVCAVIVFSLNYYVKTSVEALILSPAELPAENIDCILVLGTWVQPNGQPSTMLTDRLDKGLELYEAGLSDRLLMTGDHGRVEYNEVGTMKEYATNAGVPFGHVFMDHAGFSTYESIYRAKAVFEAEKIIIVSQEYHLYRALYIAKALGLECYGVAADKQEYSGGAMREMREILARSKDFVTSLFQPLPTYLGDAIPLSGDGDSTND